VRAALQGICFQTRDILETIKQDTGMMLSKLLVDGAMANNEYLMQMQADICGVSVGKKYPAPLKLSRCIYDKLKFII